MNHPDDSGTAIEGATLVTKEFAAPFAMFCFLPFQGTRGIESPCFGRPKRVKNTLYRFWDHQCLGSIRNKSDQLAHFSIFVLLDCCAARFVTIGPKLNFTFVSSFRDDAHESSFLDYRSVPQFHFFDDMSQLGFITSSCTAGHHSGAGESSMQPHTLAFLSHFF